MDDIKNFLAEFREENKVQSNILLEKIEMNSKICEVLKSKLEMYENDMRTLKDDNKTLRLELEEKNDRIDNLENALRANNMIIYGVQEEYAENGEELEEKVISLFREKINVSISTQDISEAHRIGRGSGNTSRPILVKCIAAKKKREIFEKKTQLRGTDIFVNHDLAKGTYQKQQVIRGYVKRLKERGMEARIRGNNVYVDGKECRVSDIENIITNWDNRNVNVEQIHDSSSKVTESEHAQRQNSQGRSETPRIQRNMNNYITRSYVKSKKN